MLTKIAIIRLLAKKIGINFKLLQYVQFARSEVTVIVNSVTNEDLEASTGAG